MNCLDIDFFNYSFCLTNDKFMIFYYCDIIIVINNVSADCVFLQFKQILHMYTFINIFPKRAAIQSVINYILIRLFFLNIIYFLVVRMILTCDTK